MSKKYEMPEGSFQTIFLDGTKLDLELSLVNYECDLRIETYVVSGRPELKVLIKTLSKNRQMGFSRIEDDMYVERRFLYGEGKVRIITNEGNHFEQRFPVYSIPNSGKLREMLLGESYQLISSRKSVLVIAEIYGLQRPIKHENIEP